MAGYPVGERGCCASGAWSKTEGPFWELINFSDCEGVIGPEVSAKLARDFAEWQSKVDEMIDPDEGAWFKVKYGLWRLAFETAADGGCVRFH